MSLAEAQIAQSQPPRRGAVIALTVDSTARAYDLTGLALGGKTPEGAGTASMDVVLWMQAETNDVFFHFHSASATDLNDATVIAVGASLAFNAAYGACLEAGASPIKVRINRAIDKFLVVKAASTSGTLRFWACSDST